MADVTPERPPALIRDPEGPLELRPPRVQDAPALVEAIRESLPELKGFMPWAHWEENNTVAAQYTRLADQSAAYWKGKDYLYHLFEPGEERLLGSVGLHRRALNARAVEVGYWGRTSAAGRGLCTRAVQALLVVAFERFGFKRVQCGFDLANEASARVNAKVGFRVEGDLRDYGPAGTAAMRADGWRAEEVNRMTSISPDEARAQPWFAPTLARVELLDWLGQPV